MTFALLPFIIPFATDRGFSPATAAQALSFMAGISIFGTLLAGAVSDHIGRKNILAVAYAVLLLWHDPMALYVFALIGGLSWMATPPAVMALISEVYGMRAIGTLGSLSVLSHQVGGGISVWMAGLSYDQTGSYALPFSVAIIALLGAVCMSLSIAERRYSVRYLFPEPPAIPG